MRSRKKTHGRALLLKLTQKLPINIVVRCIAEPDRPRRLSFVGAFARNKKIQLATLYSRRTHAQTQTARSIHCVVCVCVCVYILYTIMHTYILLYVSNFYTNIKT